jgi:hypothetical protein
MLRTHPIYDRFTYILKERSACGIIMSMSNKFWTNWRFSIKFGTSIMLLQTIWELFIFYHQYYQQRRSETVSNKDILYGGGLLVPCLTNKLKDHPFLVIHNLFHAVLTTFIRRQPCPPTSWARAIHFSPCLSERNILFYHDNERRQVWNVSCYTSSPVSWIGCCSMSSALQHTVGQWYKALVRGYSLQNQHYPFSVTHTALHRYGTDKIIGPLFIFFWRVNVLKSVVRDKTGNNGEICYVLWVWLW